MSLNQSLNISLGSMKNNQYALSVVAHNIANLHTPGYVKQRVDFQESVFDTGNDSVYGRIRGLNGSVISSISDYLDEGLLRDIIDTGADAAYDNALNDALSGLDDITNALGDDGLNGLLNAFYKAASDLEKYPNDIAIRQQYIQAAQNVCEKFNDVSKKLNSSKEDMIDGVNNKVDNINTLLTKIADANKGYLTSGKTTSAKSEIYNLLDELSQYTDATITTNANGTVTVAIGGVEVVQGAKQNYTLEAEINPEGKDKTVQLSLRSVENPDFVLKEGVTEAFSKGALSAQVEFLNGTTKANYFNYDDIQSLIDEAANNFATELNNIQTYGAADDATKFAAYLKSDGAGNTTLEKVSEDMLSDLVMFNTTDGSTVINAKNIQINQSIIDNPGYIAAARIDLDKYTTVQEDGTVVVSDDWKNAVGNSDNATEITNLQNKKFCSFKGNDCTLSKFLANLAGKVGADVTDIASKAKLSQDLADASATNYANSIGVNIDEELSDMIRFQRAYEASAKIFSTVNNLYDTILSMV